MDVNTDIVNTASAAFAHFAVALSTDSIQILELQAVLLNVHRFNEKKESNNLPFRHFQCLKNKRYLG